MYWDFKAGIRSLWRWKKDIWVDRPWGSETITRILAAKIKMDAEQIQKNQHIENVNNLYNQMMKVVNLLERYNKNEYTVKYREEHDKKWGEDKHYFIKTKSGNYLMGNDRDDRLTEEGTIEQEKKEFKFLKK